MISFPDWFKELCSNYVWYERSILHHKPETFKKVCDDVYTIHSADQNGPFPPIEESRRFVSNKLNKINPDKVKVDWVTKALEKHEAEKKEEWIPVTGEERQRRLAELRALIDSMPMINNFPRVTEVERAGQVLPPKPEPYPITTPEEAYVRDRHFEWIKNNFEARTAQKLPSWICEEDWNVIYDDQHLNGKGL